MDAMSETQDIRDALEKASLSDIVADISHRLDEDSTGAPAVWIWVVVDDHAAANNAFSLEAEKIRNAIREALQSAGIDRWPYVRFRTRSEKAEFAGQSGT